MGRPGVATLQFVNSLVEANQYLKKVGQHAEPLANDALQHWIREATVQEMNGVY